MRGAICFVVSKLSFFIVKKPGPREVRGQFARLRFISHWCEILVTMRNNGGIHPLEELRGLLHRNYRSRRKFARTLGISPSYIVRIERRQKDCPSELADKISLCYGVDPVSLKRGKGFLIPLVFSLKVDFRLGPLDPDVDRTDEQIARIVEASNDYAALLKVRSKHERLRLAIEFWRRHLSPDGQSEELARAALKAKLNLLFDAAKMVGAFYPVLMQLNRVADYLANKCHLRKVIAFLPQPSWNRRKPANAPQQSK
jgi:transcriptional regulator with XRE-family HTH domain